MNPLEMPAPLPVRSKTFDLFPQQVVTPIGGGFIQTIDRHQPVWVASWSTPPLRDERYNLMVAFLDSLEGAAQTFYGYDPRRPTPWAYRTLSIGSAPWGAATITGGNHNTKELFINATASLTMTPGDYVSFRIGDIWYLFRVQVGGTGTGINMLVNPRPPSFVGQSYPARLIRAGCEMKMTKGSSWQDAVDSNPQVSFNGIQYFERSS